MLNTYWKMAHTRHDVDHAQQVRWQSLIGEVGIPSAANARVPRDVSPLDNLSTVQHLLVYREQTPIGTARLACANQEVAAASRSELGLELEQIFDLGALYGLRGELAEVSRLCMLRSGGPGAVLRLYEGLYVVSRQLGVRYWVGGVDCQTARSDDATLMHSALEQRGLMSERFRLTDGRHGTGLLEFDSGSGAAVSCSQGDYAGARRGRVGQIKLASTLETFTRRLGARCVGAPARHPVFSRFVMPMLVDLNDFPEATLAGFDLSLLAPALRAHSTRSHAGPDTLSSPMTRAS